MSFAAHRADPPSARAVLRVLALLLATGIGVTALVLDAAATPDHAARASTSGGVVQVTAPIAVRPVLAAEPAAAAPVRIRIPAIGVNVALVRIHRNAAGVLQPPKALDVAGWYAEGVVPGAVGPAVIAGHLDTRTEAAVFVDLHLLRAGDQVFITDARGAVHRFRVTGQRLVAKGAFPAKAVYGATPDAELRLITCSDPFDPATGTYADNRVIFATAD